MPVKINDYIKGKYIDVNIIKFIEDFPDETSCKEHFRTVREQECITCKGCYCTRHYWLKAKYQWQCSECGFRTTIRSGTMMENSNLPLRKWYLEMAFMSFSKKGISATELQKQLGHKRYEPIWLMIHKIRKAMGQRDSLCQLDGMVEFNEGYFTTQTSKKDKKNLKRRRGSQKQKNVSGMAESTPLEDLETGKTSKHCRYFKMKVLESHFSKEINQVIEDNIDEKSIVSSDKSTSYIDIADYIDVHVMEKSSNEPTVNTPRWMHIAISNAKRTLFGIYHKIKGKYLQLYLDEFCYKLNRRYLGDRLFDRITIAVASNYWYDKG